MKTRMKTFSAIYQVIFIEYIVSSVADRFDVGLSQEFQSKKAKTTGNSRSSSKPVASSSQTSDSALADLEKLSQTISPTPLSSSQSSSKPAASTQSSKSSTPSATLPLVFPPNLKKRTTMLVQLEDNKMDLTGDVGAIGRLHTRKEKGVMLDIKGQQYTGEIVPCGTFLVVGIGPTEAKVESIMSDFCQISRKRNVFDKMKGVVTEGIMDESYTYVEDHDQS